MRLFVGIPFAASVIDELAIVSKRLQSKEDGLRWSAPESWHITLQFLGDTTPPQYECIVTRLRDLHPPPVPIQLEAMGFFDRAGVFFIGVSVTPALLSLQRRVTAATSPCGFLAEDRTYRPHITLARAKGKARTFATLRDKISPRQSFSSFVADEFILYESLTRSTGSQYERRDRFRLARHSASADGPTG